MSLLSPLFLSSLDGASHTEAAIKTIVQFPCRMLVTVEKKTEIISFLAGAF
jgi:hypothetical protein